MAYLPYCKFHFKDGNDENKSNGLVYALWISPNTDKVDLVTEGESKYVQLNKEKSAKLFDSLIGKELSSE
ncbi:hypothetical protein [Domibacillus tundrae]|uniref:hypothetical protein n=1 Tax=Domibacillus tundrae TaxID=1587527 RepID=UPI0033976037